MLLGWLLLLLVASVGRRLGGVFLVVAKLPLGRIRYRCRSFNMAQRAHDARVKKRTPKNST